MNNPDVKYCYICQRFLPRNQDFFYIRADNYKERFINYCKQCCNNKAISRYKQTKKLSGSLPQQTCTIFNTFNVIPPLKHKIISAKPNKNPIAIVRVNAKGPYRKFN